MGCIHLVKLSSHSSVLGILIHIISIDDSVSSIFLSVQPVVTPNLSFFPYFKFACSFSHARTCLTSVKRNLVILTIWGWTAHHIYSNGKIIRKLIIGWGAQERNWLVRLVGQMVSLGVRFLIGQFCCKDCVLIKHRRQGRVKWEVVQLIG